MKKEFFIAQISDMHIEETESDSSENDSNMDTDETGIDNDESDIKESFEDDVPGEDKIIAKEEGTR